MRKLRAAFVGILLAVPAALVLPGVVPAAASGPSCGGVPPLGQWSVSIPTRHGGGSVTLQQGSTQIGGPSFGSGGTAYFSDSSGSPSSALGVAFGGTSNSTVVVTAPGGARSGHVDVCLSNDNQLYDAGPYTFDPSISSVSPAAAAEGQTVVVNGNFYNSQLSVSVGRCGVSVAGFNESQLQFKMPGPADACSGTVAVSEVANDNAQLSTTGGSVSVVPVVSGVSCASPCYPGQAVSVSGTGFGGHGSWSNGGAGGTYSGSDSGLSFPAPDGSEGGSVTVTNDVGQSATNGSISILPHISGLSPSTAKDGDTVTVNGQDFGSSPGSVTLGGQPLDAANLSGWGMDKVTFVVPAGAVPGAVGITTGDGHPSVNTSNLNLAPVISSVTPTQAAPGSYVTISGSTFGQNPGSLTIGGKTAQIADWADTAIIALVPSGASTGKVIVNSGYGTSVAWGQNFTVLGGGSASGSGGSGGYSGYTNSGTMNVTPNYGFLPLPKAPPGVAFHLTAPATDVKPGAPVALTVNLQINGKAVAGATITFQVASSPGEGTALSAPSAVTDQNGVAHVTLTTSKKPGQTIVIAHSGAFADQIRILTLSPTAALGGLGTTILRTTNTLDPHILFPFIGALVLAVLLLLGTVILQFALHRRSRVPVPAASSAATVVAETTAVSAEPPAAVSGEPAAKPRKPRAPRARKPALAPTGETPEQSEPIALGLAAGAEDIAPVIPLRPADQQPEPKITRTRATAKARE